MSNNRKEEIIMATLELASAQGLGNVSMNMIADRVGIKKPSLYSHFESKEEIVEAMYEFLRGESKKNNNMTQMDYSVLIRGKTAHEVLNSIVESYRKMNSDKNIRIFYRVIYSERCIQPVAARIMKEETERMIVATKQLFYAIQIHKLLEFTDPDMSAKAFALTIHGFMDYEMDKENAAIDYEKSQQKELQEYIEWFCKENAVR